MTTPALFAEGGGAVAITGGSLTIPDVARVARSAARLELSPSAVQAVRRGFAALERHARAGRTIYGLTTGVGALDRCDVAQEDGTTQQRSLLRSHAAGVGARMADDQVRAMVLARLNALARGMSGVALPVVEALLELLRRGVTPVVPEGGSVGASDLAPLAHVGLVLIGEGRARFGGSDLPAAEALARAGLAPLDLVGRDALALINGLAQTTGVGALAASDGRRLLGASETATAMALVATRAPRDFLDERFEAAKPHPGTVESARRLRELSGTPPRTPSVTPVPDPGAASRDIRTRLSLRYAPAVHGAYADALVACERAVTLELNSAVDNPLVDELWLTNNSGLTTGQVIGQSLDALATAATSIAVASERRTAALLDPAHSGGLPAFLLHPDARPGVHFGLMIAGYTAASLVAELRTRAVAASVQSIPTCAGTEDLVSMSALAARRAAHAVATAETVVAIELLCGAQALDLASVEAAGPLEAARAKIRSRVPTWIEDRRLGEDIDVVVEILRGDAFARPE